MRWLVSSRFDLLWFILPNWISVVLAVILHHFLGNAVIPFWFWFVFVLCIDVGHVYSTLFRVYFVPEERKNFSQLIWLIPVLVWIGGALLYSTQSSLFWTVLAYIAVFHFIRQQYGFFVIYQNEHNPTWNKFAKGLLYLSMLHPVVYWHSHPERVFRWFVQDDFIFTDLSLISAALGWTLCLGLLIYLVRTLFTIVIEKRFDQWRPLTLLFGTALSWHIGIVAINSDIVFTVTNVLAHGIPYYGLVLAYSVQRQLTQGNEKSSPSWIRYFLALGFICLCCIGLAYLEEGLWHSLHWRSYMDSFVGFQNMSQVENPALVTLIISLLAVPQATHYVLDGFIWKLRGPKSIWTKHFHF